MKNKRLPVALLITILFCPLITFSLTLNVRSFDHPTYTRLVVEADRPFSFDYQESTQSLQVELQEKALTKSNLIPIRNSKLVDNVIHRVDKNKSTLHVRLKSNYKIQKQFVLENPFRVVFDLQKSQERPVSPTPTPTPPTPEVREETPPPAEQEQETPPPIRTEEGQQITTPHKPEQIETICIDAGHGGSDMGAISPNEIAEKDITLKVAKKLRRIILSRLGLRVVMTRDADSEMSLNSRVAIANNQKAQMFVSIHVNSSYRKAARGSETYFVSLKATDQDALALSQKENNSFKEIEEMTEDDELKMILWDMAQNEYIKESSKLAEYIQYELNILLHTRNRGVKQAPFRVLMRAAMPAVLVEVAFLSNSTEEKQLQEEQFLERVADAIYQGISKYIYYHNSLYR